MFNIDDIKRKLLIKYPFFGSVIANVKYKEDSSVGTAATDGEIIYYNSEFLRNIDLKQQLFVIAHEVCHIAFNHILRSENKNLDLWNTATDAVINAFLMKDGLQITDGMVNMPEAINYDAEELYEKLLNEMNNNCSNCNQDDSNQNNSQSSGSSGQQGGSSSDNSTQSGSGQESSERSDDSSKSLSNDKSADVSSASYGSTNNSKEQAEEKSNGSNENGSSEFNESDSINDNSNGTQDGKTDKKLDDDLKSSNGENSNGSQSDILEQENNKDESDSSLEKTNQNDLSDSSQDDTLNNNKFNNSNHDLWEDAIKKNKEEKTNDEIKDKQDEIDRIGEKETFKKNREEKKKQLSDIRKMIVGETYESGDSTNEEIIQIDDIGSSKPIIDWRYVLKTNAQFDYDWSYRNSYIEDGVLNATLEEQPFCETEVLIDTSGSIDEVMLRNFLMECRNILKVSRLKIGCFDTKFYGFNEIRCIEDLKNLKIIGNGGTNFDCAVNAFSFRVDNRIIFTDGYADMPKKAVDAIWMVFGGKQINPKGGQVYYVTQEQLERLCCVDESVKTLKKNL